ncbi:type II secretion system F family protein [Methylomonas sp. AM2-LC]|uniref:type II secretion system F family protein n=1 Tax=Methylomonas sp. AM2-LC TaxID=3153301 RepID=UPI003265D4A4
MVTPKEQIDFIWEGFDKQNHKVKNQLTAKNETTARAELRRMGFRVVKIKPKPKPLFTASAQKITPANIAVFSRQMETMLKAGIPLVQSLDIIAKGQTNPSMAKMLFSIKADIEGGDTLAQALGRKPLYFDDLFCNLVYSGEQAGVLDTMLAKIATYKEKTETLKKKINSAFRYPAIVFTVAIGVTIILLIFVVPVFSELFKSFGAELPAYTQMIVELSNWVQKWWWLVLGIIGGAFFTFTYFKKRSRALNQFLDKYLLVLPVVGALLHKSAIARFARTLGIMSTAGVPLVEALSSVAGACGNSVYYDALMKVRDDIATGQQLQFSMTQTGLFPSMVVQMVAIGEESGSIDAMLGKVADFYEEEVDQMVENMSSMIEPIIIVVMGTLVAGLLVAMYLPIFKLGSVVG